MRLDAAEWRGTGNSVVFHVALVAALSLSLAKVALPPEPPAIAVEFVDDIGLESVAAVQESALATQATTSEPEELVAEPEPDVAPPPPEPAATPAPPRDRTETPTPRTETPRRNPRPTGRLDDLDLDGRQQGNTSREADGESGQAAAPRIDAAAMTSITQAIRRQVQPCADLQQIPGPEARDITVILNLRLARDGRLLSRPRVTGYEGVTASNRRYRERVAELAVNAYVGCAPLRGLPQDLYSTPTGGWSNLEIGFDLKGRR